MMAGLQGWAGQGRGPFVASSAMQGGRTGRQSLYDGSTAAQGPHCVNSLQGSIEQTENCSSTMQVGVEDLAAASQPACNAGMAAFLGGLAATLAAKAWLSTGQGKQV